MWSNVKNHGTLLSNVEQCQKTQHIAQEIIAHHLEILSEETLAIMLRKKLTKLQFRKATDKTITTESLSIIQRIQPKPSDKHTFRFPLLTLALSTKLWMLVVAKMKNTLRQQNSTAAYVLVNALEGQNGLKNETINHAWLCDLIYNPLLCIIYMIPEEKPISSCTSESKSVFNSNSNSNNDDNKNTSSSFTQYDNKNINDLDSNSNPKIYIALPDLSKEQKLKWYSDNNKDIMPECTYDTNTDSLVKKRINIRGGIIDAEYVRNIIAMLQNNSEKIYIIEPNKKIAQTIFLLLVKIAQLVSVEKREKLGITARGIQRFGSTDRINIPVNMAEEKIVDKEKIISTRQLISILSYDQYMLTIKREVKDQAQLFEAEATICELGEIGLTNLYISAKSPKNIKIPIYNTTEKVIKIPKRTIIGYLTKLRFRFSTTLQICGHYITNHLRIKQILSVPTRTIGTDEHRESRLTSTDITKDIKTGDEMPIKQKAYRVPPASHKIIHQEINQMLDNGLIQSSMSPWSSPVILV
ncbi:hypothetical protein G9A89_009051 [Geosiphon pyriformis]|nr:hypothetical protein G9A89_009051 [Geosiphon pyriformis]